MKQEIKLETSNQDVSSNNQVKNKLSIPVAIIIVGILIAGTIYLSFNTKNTKDEKIPVTTLSPVGVQDKILGNPNAKIKVIVYADFQCPFCGAVSGFNEPLIKMLQDRETDWAPFIPGIIENYVKKGDVLIVYRDWAFLGKESVRAAEAARCAGDQDKYFEYHDYLYSHQNGENEGNFSDTNLKSFAKSLGLNSTTFDQCLDGNKYTQLVADSKKGGTKAGVAGTPKAFIVKDGEIIGTIDGAESFVTVKEKIEEALK